MPTKMIARLPLGAGIPVVEIIMPTFSVPVGCSCTWSVVRRGPGMKCMSRLRYRNALCSQLRAHDVLAARLTAAS